MTRLAIAHAADRSVAATAAVVGAAALSALLLLPGDTRGLSQQGFEAPAPALAPVAPLTPSGPAGELERLEWLLARNADLPRLCQAAELSITLALIAEDQGDRDRRAAWLRRAEAYAREAMALRSGALEPRYLVGAAMGLRVVHESTREKLRMAAEIRAHADTVLLADPAHAGALHLLGQLNAAGMRLGGVARFLARTLMGGDVLRDASWARAEAAFRGALNREPDNPAHAYELAMLLIDTGRPDEAREHLQAIADTTGDDPRIAHFRRKAQEALAKTP